MIYDISYKTLIAPRSLRIRFDKTDEFTRIYDGTLHLALLGIEKYDAIYNRIRYLMSLKSGITYFFLTFTQKLKFVFMILYP